MALFSSPAVTDSAESWELALTQSGTPSVLSLTRQGVPTVRTEHKTKNMVAQGAYVLADAEGKRQAILMATGSEVSVAMAARDILQAEGIGTRVVSMPCPEAFEAQDALYKQSVLPSDCLARVAVEAAHVDYCYKYVGLDGRIVAMTTFGESAPAAQLFEEFGFTVDNVVAAVSDVLESV